MVKFSCEKAILQNAVAVASRAVAQKSTIPALEGILIHAGKEITVSGYDMQTGIRTKIFSSAEIKGDIVINARLFSDIIRKMPDDMIFFSADDRQMIHLRCADADFDIMGQSAEDYPEFPDVEENFFFSLQRGTLRAMIEETAFAVSTNESRPIHTGALFEIEDGKLTVVAVDGFRLAIRREMLEKMEGKPFSLVTPGNALNEVKGICGDSGEKITVTLGKRHILFETGDTQLICRRLEGDFLDYRNAIPRTNSISIIADTKTMIESVDRVSVVITDKQKSPIRCVFQQDKILLSAKTAIGEAKDICRMEGDGKGLEIGFNNRYLLDALRYAPADKVRIDLNSGVSPAIIRPTDGEEKFLYMVLPVRLRAGGGI